MNTENFDKAVPAIEVNGLTVKFPIRGGVFSKVKDYFTAVDNVSFTLPQGKILSIVGESGCGKSTLVKSLVGLVPVSSGEVNLFGLPVNGGKAGTGVQGQKRPLQSLSLAQSFGAVRGRVFV